MLYINRQNVAKNNIKISPKKSFFINRQNVAPFSW